MKPSQDHKISKLHHLIFHTAQYFEVLIAIAVIIGLIITLTTIPREILTLYTGGAFNNFLKATFNIIIGIELLKMLCRHDLDSVVEVLLFAVARSIIVEHMPIFETLLGILAIAILFLIRKFLFVSALDKADGG
ncbi:transporter [Clostridium sp. MCC353]|uniref:transporter n=1 Tax=Clostridium sp. MCC353 TaxID=2592646 RepID=UPI001C00EFBF|nr:transporter [Clostridium sp. MCC353]MBT9779313.1 transporter [Clostridium sp. MCC353]